MPIKQGYAPPGIYGPWVNLRGNSGGGTSPYTVNFVTESQAESAFGAQVEYADADGIQTLNQNGPGSVSIPSGNAVGTDRIRFRSYSVGQNIRITY